MDEAAFDRVTRAIGGRTTRRRTLGGLAGGGVALVVRQFGFEAAAQAPKPCKFTKRSDRWTLQRDCVTSSPIDIPNGVTLDGNGHTIFLQGTPSSLPYGIGVQDAKAYVLNLTLDGSGVSSASCAERGAGIFYRNASGWIRKSKVTGFSSSCGDAVRIFVLNGSSRQRVRVDKVSISDSQVGINASAINRLRLRITGNTVKNVKFGVQAQGAIAGDITSKNTIAAQTYGVVILAVSEANTGPDVKADDNTVTGAQIGMSVQVNTGATATPKLEATRNTIVGPGPLSSGATHGLQFVNGTAGSADGNKISNYFDNGGGVGCGIFIAAGADVDLGNNAFPNPPGNEQNICDNRP
ncbi:MAG: NosD domain-containing protein [Thermomicrobiales bacterium]